MNLPSGVPLQIGQDLEKYDLIEIFKGLERESFNGYVVLAVRGVEGVEESALVFLEGSVVAASHEFLRYGKSVEGLDAIPLLVNALALGKGIFDIYELSREQVRLILAFNEKARIQEFPKWDEIKKLVPSKYNPEFVKEVVQKVAPEEWEKSRMLARYGLVDIDVEADLESMLEKLRGEK